MVYEINLKDEDLALGLALLLDRGFSDGEELGTYIFSNVHFQEMEVLINNNSWRMVEGKLFVRDLDSGRVYPGDRAYELN